jgi:mono/diheme cytochrome c family protein
MARIAALAIIATTPFTAFAADWKPQIPKTWDDAEIGSHEIPLADPTGSPKHVSSDYYYRIPVRPIYKGYPVYAPGHEPPGYIEHLTQLEPIILWDDKGNAPLLKTEADWIRAGELVFDSALSYNTTGKIENLRNAEWYKTLGIPVAKDGTVPVFQYVIRTKGTVDVGGTSCAMCHTRIMPDGSILKAAQSNYPVNRAAAYGFRQGSASAPDKAKYLADLRGQVKDLHGAPWLKPDMEARIDSMSVDEIASVFEASPAGVSLRHRSNSFLPIQVPDLIGLKGRRYFDRTGLEAHRNIGDVMRYAAMNQGADRLANFAGFIPADIPRFTQLPPPESRSRYSDEQLYALALWLYSLKPPANPNKFDALAARGQKVFEREGCGTCHTPPLYSNNKLTPAKGFQIPPEHMKVYDILPISVGTDAALTMRTRRGTGYYKVPSLKGVWYRGMFPHDGSCATLEDWFDPRRLRDDYVPTGFKGYQVEKRAVPGHEFGLNLAPEDKQALIAFLKTL